MKAVLGFCARRKHSTVSEHVFASGVSLDKCEARCQSRQQEGFRCEAHITRFQVEPDAGGTIARVELVQATCRSRQRVYVVRQLSEGAKTSPAFWASLFVPSEQLVLAVGANLPRVDARKEECGLPVVGALPGRIVEEDLLAFVERVTVESHSLTHWRHLPVCRVFEIQIYCKEGVSEWTCDDVALPDGVARRRFAWGHPLGGQVGPVETDHISMF